MEQEEAVIDNLKVLQMAAQGSTPLHPNPVAALLPPPDCTLASALPYFNSAASKGSPPSKTPILLDQEPWQHQGL
jgi:hypothetical protein